jgi:hypothetical protein
MNRKKNPHCQDSPFFEINQDLTYLREHCFFFPFTWHKTITVNMFSLAQSEHSKIGAEKKIKY